VRLTAALIAHEWRYQRRTLRFRAFAGAYLALACLPAVLVYLRRERLTYAIGAAAYAGETLVYLPLLTTLLAALLSMDGVNRERSGGAWTTATLAGVSNAGYLVRRWLALLAVLLPLTLVPVAAAAGLAVAGGGREVLPALFLGPWLLHVVPLAAAVSALALGLGTIGGNAVSTFLLAILAFGVLPAVGDAVLDHFRIRFAPSLDWLDFQEATRGVARFQEVLKGKNEWWWLFPLPFTEAGFDAGTEAEQDLAAGLLLASLAAAALGTAVFYLRRTRPDVRPRRVRPDHPLRTFLVALGRLREQYTPDPSPAPADLAVFALAGLAMAGAVAFQVHRAVRYEALAAERWRAEDSGGPAPTPVDVVPEVWRVEGGFDASGSVAVQVAGTLRNCGREPRAHLAFSLDPGLRLAGAAADRGTVAFRRTWDRLAVELDPPIPPGGRRELRFRLAGQPGEPELGFPKWAGGDRFSFLHAFKRHNEARFGHDRNDLSRAYRVPAVSGFRVALAAPCLTPVPRYTPWTPDGRGFVPEESYLPAARIELSLAVPGDLLAADSCGGLSAAPGRPGRLDSRCTLPVSELAVMGGRQRLLPGGKGSGESGVAVAVFPGHRASGELHLGFLARGTRLMDEAWPGLGGLGRLVVLEWPPDEVHVRRQASSLLSRWRSPDESLVRVTGNLVFLEEADLIGTREIAPEPMVAEIAAARLTHRRRLDPEDSFFFRQLFRALVLQRLGLGSQTGAVFTSDLAHRPSLHTPALHAVGFYSYWTDRFPALVAALSRRAGAEPLRASLEELLARGGDKAATFAEWAEILKRRSDGPVEPLFRDFFFHGAMPEPTLEDVDFQPAGSGWRVTGKVRNEGDGEAECRVVLTTDLGPVETAVKTGTGETASFVLATPHRPQGVYLDPDQECHRFTTVGVRDRVFFQGGRR
jgi:ABC-type transport system involved in multi-copper enzyme maturation permease subunit